MSARLHRGARANGPRRGRWVQAGFTLVELMIGLALGLLIVLALITLLVNVNRNNSEMSKTNSMIEGGRFTLQMLETDIIHAGFLNGYVPQFDDLTIAGVPGDVPTAVPDPCLDYTTPWTAQDRLNMMGIAVQAYEVTSPVPSPTVPVCASAVVRPVANTDVLIVRHAETCLPGESNCAADTAGDLYFQVSSCGTDTATFVLDTAGLGLHRADCTTIADKRKFMSSIYYVRDYAVTVGDGIPTLVRSQYGLSGGTLQHLPAQALVEGVDGFRVELGIDDKSKSGAAVNFAQAVAWPNPAVHTSPTNRGDGSPDSFVRCPAAGCTSAQLMNVVAVKLYALVRAEKPTPLHTDDKTYTLGSKTMVVGTAPLNYTGAANYKRHLFTQAVRLTNISGRRETPN